MEGKNGNLYIILHSEIKLPSTSQKKDLWVMHIVKEGTLIA
jgi:hypothetical protein